MARDSSWEVQKAVFAQLSSAGSVTTLLAQEEDSIFDHVPTGAALPYIVIGEMEGRPFDTHTYEGCEIHLTIHCFSQGEGFKETRNIMAAVSAVLHDADLSIENQHSILCLETEAETLLENDGKTHHGKQHFRIVTEPA